MTDRPVVDLPHPENNFSLEVLDSRIQTASQALCVLDQLASGISLSSDGHIHVNNLIDSSQINDPKYRANLQGLINRFDTNNGICADQYRQDSNVLDSRVVHGAVVVIYDSSIGLPAGFSPNTERGTHSSPSTFWSRDITGNARELSRLGLITVDVNPNLRQDGVDPTTSLRHEFHHHTLSVTDYLITQDNQIAMASAYRTGRNASLFGKDKGRLTTNAAFEQDLDKYATLTGRPVEDIKQIDIETQLGYLNELHSSLLQGKPEWFSAGDTVYNNRGNKGRYFEVVGHSPQDADIASQLLAVVQSFHICRQIINTFTQRGVVGEGQKILIQEAPIIETRVAAEIGAARTISQANRLISAEWQNFVQSEWGSKLTQNGNLRSWAKEVAASPWASPNFEKVFFGTQSNG